MHVLRRQSTHLALARTNFCVEFFLNADFLFDAKVLSEEALMYHCHSSTDNGLSLQSARFETTKYTFLLLLKNADFLFDAKVISGEALMYYCHSSTDNGLSLQSARFEATKYTLGACTN